MASGIISDIYCQLEEVVIFLICAIGVEMIAVLHTFSNVK